MMGSNLMKNTTIIKRLTALLLTLIMSVSIFSTAAISANAAVVTSVSASGIAKDIAMGYAKEIVDATAGSNPVTKVLGSVGLDIFNKMINGSESKPVSTDEIMDEINAISTKMDAYHKEEMTALNVLSKKSDLLENKMDLLAFKSKCDEMRSCYVHTLSTINDYAYKITDKSLTDGTDNKAVFIIDDSTYSAYKNILKNIDTDNILDENFYTMYCYLNGSSASCYNTRCFEHLIDGYVLLQQIKIGENASFKDIPDFSEIQNEIDGLEADNVLYFATYMNIIQMKYQCENYEAYADYLKNGGSFTPVDGQAYLNQISRLNGRMETINEMYQSTCDYYNGLLSAQVTLNPASSTPDAKDFCDTDLAWSTAVRTVGGSDSAAFTLLKTWKADTNGSLNPNKSLCDAGFNSNGMLTANLSGGDLTINLNKFDIDMREHIFDTLLTVTGNHTLTIYGYNGEKPDDAYLFGGALYGGKRSVVYNATSAGARLVIKNVTVYEPYDNMVEFNGKDKARDSVEIEGCFLNNTHRVYEKSEMYRLYFSNCSVNMYNNAVRTVVGNESSIKCVNTDNVNLNNRYYSAHDFIIV